MGFFQKIGQFFLNCTPGEIVVLALLILVPILSIILLIVSAVRHARNKRAEAREEAEAAAPTADPTAYSVNGCQAMPMPIWIAPAQTQASAPVAPSVPYEPQPAKVTERVVERVKVKVNVSKLNKVDKSLLAATGIFCLGLGVMIARAMSGDK